MGKNKLKKFAEMKEMRNVVECPRDVLLQGEFPHKGKWRGGFFPTSNPIVLELGCGKGEYTVGLAEREPGRNFIGIDIKGARMYTGARLALDAGMTNAAFLRTEIELIDNFFAPGEVEEIWITFPDPQMKKVNKRLTSTRFLRSYRKIASADAVVRLKTDSPFLFEYTRRLAAENGLEVLDMSSDLHGEGRTDDTTAIKTAYEAQWLARGKKIKYISFRLGEGQLTEPDVSDLEKDDYRAVPRFNPNEELKPNPKYDTLS
ncbi:MAG: tRNA (guanosine(46)-N7)-methyltransferase TrmB [Muribaculaceae bacterium]|nr:tRNA (guanosine(46)-N7)-methyltransferase TrmB [Bacteroides sp.]MDE6806064.1 tRNA (guanosine(46)-N7)-methyltransferase TrmB [Muribaculaceae bacterium]MDE7509767.1 tRNA (guanosine(46)-N7)-methyltransferase TrmB [Muribaculaceae bacterium]